VGQLLGWGAGEAGSLGACELVSRESGQQRLGEGLGSVGWMNG
jgi:hypothetical protein